MRQRQSNTKPAAQSSADFGTQMVELENRLRDLERSRDDAGRSGDRSAFLELETEIDDIRREVSYLRLQRQAALDREAEEEADARKREQERLQADTRRDLDELVSLAHESDQHLFAAADLGRRIQAIAIRVQGNNPGAYAGLKRFWEPAVWSAAIDAAGVPVEHVRNSRKASLASVAEGIAGAKEVVGRSASAAEREPDPGALLPPTPARTSRVIFGGFND